MTLDTAGPRPGQDAGDRARYPRGRRPVRRLLIGGAWTAAALAAFAVYLRLASTRAVNSDGAGQALQAWDMLHGNPLLRGWTTSDVSFYTTELPQYALIELVHGLNADIVHIAAAMTYTLVVLLAALVAKGTATGREAVARVAVTVGIMLAPQLAWGTDVLLSSPDHTGTAAPLLLALLVIDRVRRPHWWVPVVVSLLLALALVADSIVLVAGVIPLILVCVFQIIRGVMGGAAGGRGKLRSRLAARWYEIALAGGAIVAVGVAQATDSILHALGGYTVQPLAPRLAPLGEILSHNLPVAAQCLLRLFGADFLGLPAGAATYFIALHVAGVALGAAGIALAAWRFRRDGDLVSQLLLAGAVVNFVSFALTTRSNSVTSAREIAPVLPFVAALAARQLARHLAGAGFPRRLARRITLAALCAIGAGYAAGLGLELTAPTAPPMAAQLTAWLESHPLGTGLSGYWEGSVVTLTSGGRVAVRPVIARKGQVLADTGEVQAGWYDPARSSADFVVLAPGVEGFPGFTYGGFTQREAVVATFGEPARTYQVGQYTILWWPKNLLTELPATG